MNYEQRRSPSGRSDIKKISVSIRERLWKDATAYAKAEGITLSAMIEIALRHRMDTDNDSIDDRLKKLESVIATLKPLKK